MNRSLRIDSDDFELFGLPRRHAIERGELDRQWRELQARVHPDRFASQGSAAQRLAMQWAVRVNEAYRRLKDPVSRAAYLCELGGAPIDAERNTVMPASFLAHQMQWREALEESRSAEEVEALRAEVSAARASWLDDVRRALDERGDAAGAAQGVRALMFIERFVDDLEHRLEALGQ